MDNHIRKIIFVDKIFLEDLNQISRRDLEEFSYPGLDTKVIELPLSPTNVDEVTALVDPSAIRPGSIVVRPGYTDQFVPVDAFSEDLMNRKYGLFVQLCIALGAKNVSVSNIDNVSLGSDSEMGMEAGVDVRAPLASGSAEFSSKKSGLTENVRKSIMEMKTSACGGEPDFEKADTIIRQYGLQKDSLFMDMLGMCRVTTNRLSRHELSLDFSTDVKRIFDSSIHAKIKVMSKLYEGNVDFEKAKRSVERTRTATKLSVVVQF
jgi:hypothetical protein